MAAKHACEVVIVAEASVPTFALLPRATMYANGGRKFHSITAETRRLLHCVRTCYGRLRKHLRGFSTSRLLHPKRLRDGARKCSKNWFQNDVSVREDRCVTARNSNFCAKNFFVAFTWHYTRTWSTFVLPTDSGILRCWTPRVFADFSVLRTGACFLYNPWK